MNKKSGFTLIELLVVIAIIAILAAILFPVFAQAKAAAKKTAALSNTKQIATSMMLYSADEDDRFPSVYDNAPGNTTVNGGGDPIITLFPYTKNLNMWNQYRPNAQPVAVVNGVPTRGWNDYGYNWGFEIRVGEGMVSEERCTDGGLVVGCGGRGGQRFNTGKSNTEMVNPAQLFAFGNTYDTPRQTMGGVGWFFDRYPGTDRNSSIYFTGQITASYADGHAKVVPFKGGVAAGTRVASPKNFLDRVNGYCFDPDALINPFPRSGFPLGRGIPCRTVAAYPEAQGVVWWND